MSTPEPLNNLLCEALSKRIFSGYQLYAEHATKGVIHLWDGQTSYWDCSHPIDSATYFDLGSLTKVIATTSILARLFESKKIDLENPISKHLPGLNSNLGRVTLQELLSHSSGLKSWAPLYLETDQQNLLNWFSKNTGDILTQSDRGKMRYSDLGFLLLGLVIDKNIFSKVLKQEVFQPLHLAGIQYGPIPKKKAAATEYCLWRKRLLHGEIFDENAYALGGQCAHAGLFSSAESLAPWARAWLHSVLGKSTWLKAETAQLFTKRFSRNKAQTWALGWDTKSTAFSTAGDYFSASSFGHLGYPGCSIWIDPQNEFFVIFLSNRIHPSRYDERIKSFRPQLHNEIARCLSTFSMG